MKTSAASTVENSINRILLVKQKTIWCPIDIKLFSRGRVDPIQYVKEEIQMQCKFEFPNFHQLKLILNWNKHVDKEDDKF